MFVLSHLFPAFLDHASHDLPSFQRSFYFIIPLTLSLSHWGRGKYQDDPLKIPSSFDGGGEALHHVGCRTMP
jgi:hypothetical protein